jgi:hypothetical protein
MFNLEEKISEWRKQMLAAGIKTLALDELENHLHEEIERQLKLGLDARLAFETAVQQIGESGLLKLEFSKARDFSGGFHNNKFITSMKTKAGICVTAMTLFMALVLQVFNTPLVVRMHKVIRQGTNTMVDSSWQIKWYAFVLAGLIIVGIVLMAWPKRGERET